jgi:hypothetical protein
MCKSSIQLSSPRPPVSHSPRPLPRQELGNSLPDLPPNRKRDRHQPGKRSLSIRIISTLARNLNKK